MRLPTNNSLNEYLEDDYYFNDTFINEPSNTTTIHNHPQGSIVISIILCMFGLPFLICLCNSLNRCCEDLSTRRSSIYVNNNIYNYDSDNSNDYNYDSDNNYENYYNENNRYNIGITVLNNNYISNINSDSDNDSFSERSYNSSNEELSYEKKNFSKYFCECILETKPIIKPKLNHINNISSDMNKYINNLVYHIVEDSISDIINNQINEEVCCICMENLKIDNSVKLISCNHRFHKECISVWFENNSSCPICRKIYN